jgi:hypothetical protein
MHIYTHLIYSHVKGRWRVYVCMYVCAMAEIAMEKVRGVYMYVYIYVYIHTLYMVMRKVGCV